MASTCRGGITSQLSSDSNSNTFVPTVMKKQWFTDNLAKGGIGYKDIVCFTNGRHISASTGIICMIAVAC